MKAITTLQVKVDDIEKEIAVVKSDLASDFDDLVTEMAKDMAKLTERVDSIAQLLHTSVNALTSSLQMVCDKVGIKVRTVHAGTLNLSSR